MTRERDQCRIDLDAHAARTVLLCRQDDDAAVTRAEVVHDIARGHAGVLASDNAPGWREVPLARSHPKMFSRWHTIGPEALYWAPKFVQTLWNAKKIHITENGCAADDVIAADGQVYDTDRIMFLRNCLTQLQRATADGVPVRGYFQWSLMDNLEWNAGFGNRFGIMYVDFKTQKRTPKMSAAWFREAARRNAVV